MSKDLYHSNLHTAQNPAPVPAEVKTQQPTTPPAGTPTSRAPGTRTSAAWIGICAAALVAVFIIVFMLQNTGSVEVNFLGMRGSLPLALALLIAAVGTAILTMAVGTARITQLRRRLPRRPRH
jgi:uncharacterized integral membrane protein